MEKERFIVVGGDAAGMSAASRIRKRRPESEVVVYEAGQYVSYSACGMPFHIGGVVKEFNSLVHYSVEKFRKERNIEIKLGATVTAINRSTREITFTSQGTAGKDHYDHLVIATGASAKVPENLRGVPHVYTLRTLNDLQGFESALDSVQDVTIVGAGYIGLELAESMRSRGKMARIIQHSDRILRGFDKQLSGAIMDEVLTNSVQILMNTEIRQVEEFGGNLKVSLSNGESFNTQMIVVATGVRPNSQMAKDAGLELGVSGTIRVNEYMETSDPLIFAAGDVACSYNMITGKEVYMPLATGSNKSGRIAGENAAGGRSKFAGIAGTEVVKVFSLEVGKTGLDHDEAISEGFDAVSSTITSTSRSSYYPGSSPLTIKMTADRKSRRVLGAEIIGHEGVAKRIDVVATAIYSKLTVDDMLGVDYSYSPPFAPTWEPILVAADVLSGKLE
ncbi:MAG: FAD-dependent oxidoreductase [Candidatus Thermoplasmatota archaeon]|nr:FAD-dependent oxidoreductase [Candidatus Thermoplasmatota archaeon]